MALSVYQWSYNGLTFGEQTSYIVTAVQGLNPPDAKADITQKASGDGAWTWTTYAAERHIIIAGQMVSTVAAVWTAIASLQTAFALQSTDLALAFNRPGIGAQHINCKPLNLHYDADRVGAIAGFVEWAVELVAGDPTIYSGES